MAQITVDVGVKLNVMQSSLADLQKVLSHLEPDSAGFKSLSKIIAEMTREMEKFQVQTSKGFTSGKQFDQAERSIEKMEETLTKAQIAMSNLKFSDIKLDANQTKAFNELEQAIVTAEQRLDSIKEKTKQGIFSDTAAVNTLRALDKNGIQKSFDEIDAIVENGTKKIEGDLINAKAKFDELNRAVSEQTAASNKAKNLLSNGITQQDWGALLNKNGTGFKAGGKQEFLKILKDQFEVSDADIAALQKMSFGKINEAFKGNQFPDIFKGLNESLSKNSSGLDAAKKELTKYEELQKAVDELHTKMAASKESGTPLGQGMSAYNAEIERVAQALAKLRGEAVQNVSTNSTFSNSISAMQGQLQGFANQLNQASAAFLRLQSQQQTFNSIKMAITNFMGFNQILNLTKTAVRDAMNHIKELDSVMNGISIVTNMSTADLWKQVDAYSAMAQNFGVSIKGAYEVSQIYYQQGLETNDVLNLTNETLKLCKVSGLDYAQATDYMTTAIRGFKMEMSEASNVVDVYSNLAANTAVSQEELAVAMSKTASSMESVGSTFEETSAMIATMVAVTRESATNIGSAMKSIASRYGELTKDPSKLMDEDGEAMVFNKVDAALQSIGISMKTVDGQFREFTDVILELSGVWDQLTSVQQRYIATQFAGNRQQSRFLALVGNGDLLRENIETAENSEDVGTLQALKALDSLESKLSQVQVAYQQFYTTIGAENLWKGALDGIKEYINTLNGLPKIFNTIPIGAIAAITNVIGLVKSILISGLSNIASIWGQMTTQAAATIGAGGQKAGSLWISNFINEIKNGTNSVRQTGTEVADAFQQGQIDAILSRPNTLGGVNFTDTFLPADFQAEFQNRLNAIQQISGNFTTQQLQQFEQLKNNISDLSTFRAALEEVRQQLNTTGGTADNNSSRLRNFWQATRDSSSAAYQGILNLSRSFVTLGMMIDKSTESGRKLSAVFTGLGGAMQTGLGIASAIGGGPLAWAKAAPMILGGVIQLVNALDLGLESPTERLERLTKEAEELSNQAKQIKNDYKTLQTNIDKLDELKEKRYESAEAAEEYQTAVDELANKFPEMIAGFDKAGNIILNTTAMEDTLAKAREKTAQATYNALLAEQEEARDKANQAKNAADQQLNRAADAASIKINGYNGQIGLSTLEGTQNKAFDYKSQYEMYLRQGFDERKAQEKTLASLVSGPGGIGENSDLGKFLIDNFQKNSNGYEDFNKFLKDPKSLGISLDGILPQISALQDIFGAKSLGQQALEKVNDILTEEGPKGTDWINRLRSALDELAKYGDGYANLVNELIKDAGLGEAFAKMSEAVNLEGELDNTSRMVISAWQQTLDNNGRAWEVLSDNSKMGVLITQGIADAAAKSGKQWVDYAAENKGDANEIVKQYEDYWSSLGESQQKALNNMLENANQYTPKDFEKFLNDNNPDDKPTTQILQDVKAYYGDSLNKIKERLQNNLKQALDLGQEEDLNKIDDTGSKFLDDYKSLITNTQAEFTKQEETFLQNILAHYQELKNEGFIEQAENFGENSMSLWGEIQNLPAEVQADVIKLINDKGVETEEAIQSILLNLKNDKRITPDQFKGLETALTGLQDQIIPNLALDVQASLDSFINGWSDASKEMKKMTTGLDLNEVQNFINQAASFGNDFSLSFDDFSTVNGKLVLSQQKAEEYWEAYARTITDKADNYAEQLETAITNLGLNEKDEWNGDQVTGEAQQAMKSLLGGKYSDFFNEEGTLKAGASIKELNEALQESITQTNENLDNYQKYLEWAKNEILNNSDWDKGDYSSLLNGQFMKGGKDKKIAELNKRGLKEAAEALQQSSIDIFNVDAFNEYLSGVKQYNATGQPELKAAIEKARGGVDDFLSGLLSKGIDNFNVTDYANTGIESSTFNEMSAAIKKWQDSQGSYEDFIRSYAKLTGKTASEIDSLIAQAHAKDYENNVYDALSEVVGSFDKFSYEAGQQLARSLGTTVEDLINKDVFSVDETTGELSSTYQQMKAYLITNMHNMSNKQYNELRAQLEAANAKQTDINIFNDIISNRDKLSEENIASLATLLNTTYTAIRNMLTQNADGSYKMDLSTIQNLVEQSKIKVNEEFKELLANEIDSIISSLTGLGQLQGKGTTSIEDMQKRVGDINQQLGTDFKMQDLFTYNENLNAFTYSTQGLQLQAASLAKELDSLKQNTEANADQIWAVEQSMRNIAIEMANNIDMSGFLGMAIGDPARELKIDELIQAIEDYNTVLAEIGETERLNTSVVISALRQGGEGAVQVAEQIAAIQGKTLSASDVESAYRNQISNFVNAIDTIVAQPGAIVDTITASIISSNGGAVNELGNTGQYVVESAANLYEAYKDLLQRMINTGEATLADLNKVAALALENRDGEQVVIDALGDAAGMTFSRFGEILADAGIELSENMINQLEASGIVDLMGGNKMRIADFSRFADLMGWDASSEEYVSAFKTYNDSLISMNRQAESNILEEVSALGDAKGGDWLNLTQLSAKLGEAIKYGSYTQLDALTTRLHTLGAELEDGILKLDSDANIPGILATIASYAQQYGGLLQQDMAELADVLDDVLSSYADAISKGINGKLTNAEALDLQNMTNGLGIDMNLNFTQTTEGLKLSQQAAIGLYQELQKINGIKAQLVFDELYKSLTQVGGGLENISQTTAEIAKVRREITYLQDQIDRGDAGAAEREKLEILREQLSLYQQIQAHQMDDPNSYKFMDNAVPTYMQGAQNYWDAVGKAYKSMNEAGKSGYMSIQDFNNIVNEMNNMAAISGNKLEFMGETLSGKAEDAANLITKGMGFLENIDGSGVKINMNNFGLDISSGAEGMQKNFQEGIKSMAQSQIDMIDAMINVLEVVVQMEKLKEIDIDSNGMLDFSEIFEVNPETGESLHQFTTQFETIREEILKNFEGSEKLKPLLEGLSINGVTLNDLLTTSVEGLKGLNLTEEQYQQMMSALYQAAISGDYDLDHLMESIQNILASTGQVFSYFDKETGKQYVLDLNSNSYTINWNEQEEIDEIKQAFADAGYTGPTDNETLRNLITEAAGGNASVETQLAYEIFLKNVTTLKDDPDGNEYEYKGKKYKTKEEVYKAITIENTLTKTGGEIVQSETSGETTTIQTKNGFKFQTKFNEEGKATYIAPNGKEYESPEALINGVRNDAANSLFGKNYDSLSEKERKRVDIAINLEARPQVTIEGELNEAELNAEAMKFRQELQDNANKKITDLIEGNDPKSKTDDTLFGYEIQYNPDSTITIDPSGMNITVAKDATSTEIENAITDYIDPDGIIAKIAKAIELAFTGDSGTTISNALADGIRTALKGETSVDLEEGAEAPEVSLPEITIKPEKISFNTSEMPEVTPEGGGTTVEVEINDITIKPTKVQLNTADMPEPESTATEIPVVPIDEINVKPNSAKLDTSAMGQPEPEEGIEPPIVPIANIKLTPSAADIDTSNLPTNPEVKEVIQAPTIPIPKVILKPTEASLDVTELGTVDTTAAASSIKVPDISIVSVILKPLLGMIDTSNTQLLGSILTGLPGDKNLTVATAKAIINSIDLDSANATFGDLAVTLPETKKKVQITDIITGLIQNVQLKTADGTGGGTKTNYDTSSITLSDGTEISIATAVATLQQLSVTLAAGEDGTTGGSVNIDGLPTEFDIAAATALLTTLSVAAGEGMAAPDISALLNEDGTYHIQAPGTVELTSTSVTQGAQIGPNLSEVGDSTDAINNALATAGTFADTYVDAVATAIKNKEALNPIDVSNIIKMDAANFDLSAIKDALAGLGTEATTASSEVAAGLATDNSATSNAGATTMGDQYIETLKTALGVASPSTYAIEAGQNVAEGLKQGIETATGPTEAVQALGDNVIQTLTTALGGETLEVTVPQLAVTPTETTLSQDLEISPINTSEVTVEELIATATSTKYKDNTIELEDIKEGKANITNLTVDSNNLIAGSGLTSLQGLDFSATSNSLGTLSGYAGDISGASFNNFKVLVTDLGQAAQKAAEVWDYVKQFSSQTFTANIQVQGGDSTINTTENKTTNEVHNVTENTTTTETHNINENYSEKIDVDTSGAQQSTSQLGGAAASMGSQANTSAGQLKTAQTALNQVGSAAILAKAQINNLKTAISQAGGAAITAKSNISNLKTAMSNMPNPAKNVSDLKTAMSGISSNASGYVSNLAKAMNSIPTGSKSASVTLKYSVQRSSTTSAAGNMGGGSFAKGTNRALVAGTRKTLMGELGPELVVSNGRYFIAGQNGAEFVDLAKDAIVFNHKQTRRLLEQGMIGSRGRPITNETNAISLAKGRIPEQGVAAALPPPSGSTTTITESISSVSVSPSQSDPIKFFSMAKGSIPSMGPALASAAAALAALKELRAMWQSLLDAGAKELGSMAGRDGGGGGGGKSCFVAGTLVRVLDGYKNIEDIQKGDLVLSYNIDKKINEYSEVVATMIHNTTEAIYSLYIEDDVIEATGIHPFFVKRDNKIDCIEAENLLIGDYVLFADGTWHRVDDIEVQILSTTVYNFEVSGNHNYYVGKNSILVHNKKSGGGGKKPSAGKNKTSPKGKKGGSCFVAGTLIKTNNGYKNIEDIQKKDVVLSYNEKLHKNEYSEVLQTMIHDVAEEIYFLYIEDEVLQVTGIHRFYIKRDDQVNWICAAELQVGDQVLFSDGSWHEIENIEVQVLFTTVYNFEVSNNHNYYVGKNSVLAHNKGGKGGGGGGGGGGDSEGEEEEIFAPIEYGTVTEEIQRWYDLLRQIDKLEQDISYQQALRKKYESDRVANGEKIYSTYQNELALLKNEIKDQKELASLQKSWYDAKRNELANTSYAKIFTYNDEGLQQYTGSGKPGSKLGLDILEHLNERNAKGKFKLNVEQQLSYLKSVGFDLTELLYNDDGTILKNAYAMNLKQIKSMMSKRDGTKESEIKNKEAEQERSDIMTQMMENFWSRIDGWRDELDSLYDSYNETATQIQENLAKQNEILQKLVDNEIKVEEDLYKAIESREQTIIDNLKKEQELLKNSTDKFIEGLNKQLSKEKEQYSNKKDKDELTKLQRQLAILQRSGGSATQIRSLQEQIDNKMQEDYFKKQEDSINTIKDAADEQIKRLEKQIDIQSEILEYQKSHGLLWEEVRYIMDNWAEEDIASSILKWDKEFKEKSDLQIQEELKEIRERIQIYTEGRDTNKEQDKNFDKYASNLEKNDTANKILGQITGEEGKKEAKTQAELSAREAYKAALNTGSTEKEAEEQAQTAYNKSLTEYKNNALNQTKTNILNKENEGKSEEEQKDISSAEERFNYWKQNQATKAKVTGSSFYSNLSSEDKNTFEKAYFSKYEDLMDKDEYKNENGTLNTEKIAQDALEQARQAVNTDRADDRKNSLYAFSKNFKAYIKKDGKWKAATFKKGNYGLATDKNGNFIVLANQSIPTGKKKNGKDITKKTNLYKLKNGYYIPASILPAAAKNDKSNLSKGSLGAKNVSNDMATAYKEFSKNPNLTVTVPKNTTLTKDLQLNEKGKLTNITKKKKLLKQTKFTISSISGLGQNGAFTKITFSKANNIGLDGSYAITAAQAKKIKFKVNKKDTNLYAQLANTIKNSTAYKNLKDITKYATGGMADFTGPAWLDGTKKKPEAVLNADQTRFLKEDLLGNSSNSLMSIVSALQDSLNSTYTSSVDNSNSVVIENLSLNFEAGIISNDYDARRAGDTVVKEILKIARKTGNNSVSRR